MLSNAKKIFFTSDHHFGIPDRNRSLEREKRFVRWLDQHAPEMEELYIMGDLFDFWFEYKTVVPRGYALLLGRLAELRQQGIPVHYFRGNHDMWTFRYFEEELGFLMYREPVIRELHGKRFFLAHGDGLGPGDYGYKFIKKVFENPVNQWLFRLIHPDISMAFALYWSRKSRYSNITREDKERADGLHQNTEWLKTKRLPQFAASILNTDPSIDYFVFGHWHLPVNLQLNEKTRCMVIGDWLKFFTYLEYSDQQLVHKNWDK